MASGGGEGGGTKQFCLPYGHRSLYIVKDVGQRSGAQLYWDLKNRVCHESLTAILEISCSCGGLHFCEQESRSVEGHRCMRLCLVCVETSAVWEVDAYYQATCSRPSLVPIFVGSCEY